MTVWPTKVRPGSKEQAGGLNSRQNVGREYIPPWTEPRRRKTDVRCHVVITFCWASPGQSPGLHKASQSTDNMEGTELNVGGKQILMPQSLVTQVGSYYPFYL